MEDTSFPNSCAHDLKEHLMKIFEEATKDCEHRVLRKMFDSIRDYDFLNKYTIEIYHVLANDTLAEEAKELFRPSPELGIPTDVAVFTIIIWAYTRAGETKSALKLYHQMIATGVAPTSCTNTILITALATNSSSDVSFVGYAKKYFLEMLDKGMKPHGASYMSLFIAIGYHESEEKAKEFLKQIQAKGFTPDSNVHHFEEGHLTEAMKVLKVYDDLVNKTTDKDMQKVFRKWKTDHDLTEKESMEMFFALIADGYEDEAVKLIKRISETGVYPVVLVYTTVIQAYLKLGKTKGAPEIYEDMLSSGVAPNSYTYTVLIKGLTVHPNSCGDAKKCILEMMDRGIRPNAATYTAVIEGFARQEDKAAEEEAKEMVEVMVSKGLVPNSKAMMEVLKGRPTPLIRRVIDIVLSKLKG